MRRPLSLFILLALSPGAAGAQLPASAERPEAVVEAYYRAVTDARWLDAVRLADLDGVDESRKQTIASLRSAPRRGITVSELLESDPQMPRAVAEYEVKRANASFTRYDYIEYEYARVPTADSLAALPVTEVAARWLEARDPRWQLQRALRDGRMSPCPMSAEDASNLRSAMTPAPPRIVGAVIDDSLAYVVIEPRRFDPSSVGRRRPDSTARQSPHPSWIGMGARLVTLRRHADRWLVDLHAQDQESMGFAAFGCGTGSRVVRRRSR